MINFFFSNFKLFKNSIFYYQELYNNNEQKNNVFNKFFISCSSISVYNSLFMIFSPLEQFEINKNFQNASSINTDINLFYSNFLNFININSLQEVILYILIFISFFFYFFITDIKFYPYSWVQNFIESFIFNIREFIRHNAGFGNQPMLIFFSTLIISLLVFNSSGMIPFAFTITSHFIATFFYSFSFFFGINYIAIDRHGKFFFNIFLPQGTPTALIPLLVGLEFISYFSRLLSLSIRLFANIMAGHALLSIFTSFAFKALSHGGFPMIISFIGVFLLFAIIFMEVSIAFLQVFVFATLASLYVVDVHSVNH